MSDGPVVNRYDCPSRPPPSAAQAKARCPGFARAQRPGLTPRLITLMNSHCGFCGFRSCRSVAALHLQAFTGPYNFLHEDKIPVPFPFPLPCCFPLP